MVSSSIFTPTDFTSSTDFGIISCARNGYEEVHQGAYLVQSRHAIAVVLKLFELFCMAVSTTDCFESGSPGGINISCDKYTVDSAYSHIKCFKGKCCCRCRCDYMRSYLK